MFPCTFAQIMLSWELKAKLDGNLSLFTLELELFFGYSYHLSDLYAFKMLNFLTWWMILLFHFWCFCLLPQAIIQLIAAASIFLSTSRGEDLDSVAVSSSVIYFISLLVGELGLWLLFIHYPYLLFEFRILKSISWIIFLASGFEGRKRSRVNFLKLYVFGSSVALLISIASLTKSSYALQVR